MKAPLSKSMILSLCLALVASSLAWRQANSQQAGGDTKADTMDRSAAATYEHLATAIIAIEATEDELVKSILLGYQAAAQGHLKAALADAPNRKTHLEQAAATIGDIANEGDKRIMAVRQRLAKAGHTHNTDVVTKEDYMFISSKEKKEVLALAQRVGKLDASAKPADIQAVQQELSGLFDRAISPE